MSATIRVSRVLHGTTAEGPGIRSAVWVQGCSIRCSGCINPQLFSFDGGDELAPESVVEEAQLSGAEGLTLLGGEPFDQPHQSAALARHAQANGLGVITFTGYAIEALQEDVRAQGLLLATDLLIDGPYEKDLAERQRALVGSTNQRFIHLSDRYRGYRPEIARNRIDLRIGADGTVEMAGFLNSDDLVTLTTHTSTRRVRRKGSGFRA
ncbi:radical SAM protein [Arthrobacter frigidicola]|nr:radical SAM protein [Arthrobacter frigidicola]